MNQLSMSKKAYQSIRDWLHTEELPKGSATSEVQLSQRLGMSRTPVRAALQQLEHEGYLRIIPKHGIIVLESSAQRVGDLLDLVFAVILFSSEQTKITYKQLPQDVKQAALDLSHFMTPELHSEAAQRSRLELGLLQKLVAHSRNQEMDHLFEQSVERLYWHANTRRWKAPYLKETTETLASLLVALTNLSPELTSRLFAYLQLLKKTWV